MHRGFCGVCGEYGHISCNKFVAFLGKQMDEQLELIIPADEQQLKRIEKLVKEK